MDTLTLTGTYTIAPDSSASTSFSTPGTISITHPSSKKIAQTVNLDADPAENVSLGDLAVPGANFILIDADKPVTAVATSSAGTATMIGEFIILSSQGTPYTALTLQRAAGVTTVADVVMADKV